MTPDNLQVAVEQPFREFLTAQAKLKSGDSYQYHPLCHPCKVRLPWHISIMRYTLGSYRQIDDMC